jgi:hypothetical protein
MRLEVEGCVASGTGPMISAINCVYSRGGSSLGT